MKSGIQLSEAFITCGSDKNTYHSYGPFYDELSNNNNIRSVLEIGVYLGGGLAAWKLYDPEITVMGVDEKAISQFTTIVTKTPDYSPVINICRGLNLRFDLIIDDGGHEEDSQILGLYYLREFLSPSGIYVIEDLQSQEVIDRMGRFEGVEIIDLRHSKGLNDDVLAVWKQATHEC